MYLFVIKNEEMKRETKRRNFKGPFSPYLSLKDLIYIGVFINIVISTSIMIHR